MSTQHTPEPWEAKRDQVNPNAWLICSYRDRPSGMPASIATTCHWLGTDPPDESNANARRIVACVNACDGINPEAVPGMLAALKDMCAAYSLPLDKKLKDEAMIAAGAAIAKATEAP